jgi:hypothetical protein
MRSASGVLTTGQMPAFKAVKRWSSTGYFPWFGQTNTGQTDRQTMVGAAEARGGGGAPGHRSGSDGGGGRAPRWSRAAAGGPGRGRAEEHRLVTRLPVCVCVCVCVCMWKGLHLS